MKLSVSVSSILVVAVAFVFVSLAFTTFSNSVFSSTAENNTVLEQAKKALDANQKQLATATPETVPMWFRQPSKKLKVPVRWKGCSLPGS